MADVRDGMANDPNRETLSEPSATLRPVTPPGSEITLNDDGTATYHDSSVEPDDEEGHLDNLAETLDPMRLSAIATDLLDQIEVDKEARTRRDKQYEEGLRRTGLGDDAPGGAPFAGASRAVHPMLTEAVIDFAARVAAEILPPEGPCKPQIIGEATNEKTSRGERVSRYMNWQLTKKISSFYSEVEMGLSQEGLAGAFYLKMVVVNNKPEVEVVHMDQVHRPWSDGDFYVQQRITHEMQVDKWAFERNVSSGLWTDDVDVRATSDNIEQTDSSRSNDRIIGRSQPAENIDDVRIVFEVSTWLDIDEEGESLPYLVTIDEQTRKVLAIYRNWEEKDANQERLDFLTEFPFQPWRGGYPIGLTHMIGGLSGAASGSLRALMDSALLNATQTGVKLKGGTTAGGQNIRAVPGQTVELQGSLATDPDVRKTYMPLPFPAPSEVLFKLLGFLVDAGRGVVRTSFDEFTKMTNEMPVGTANMMIEQGLKTYGAVFGRQHRAMTRFLEQLWRVNQNTVENEQIVDKFGELLVTKEDFTGPMVVQPVSDPRIFSDTQRQAQGQLVSGRAQVWAQLMPGQSLYKIRDAELFMLRANKVPEPEQFLVPAPMPQQLNPAAENVAAAQGLPLKAYPGQDHEAHIAQHAAFMQSPLFGMNSIIALKFLPTMLDHFAEHMALWYADAMLLATNHILQQVFKDPRITLEALQQVKGLEVQLDRLMAELTPDVMQHAQQVLAPVMKIIGEAQEMLKKLKPPTPMDPSVVAQQDVQRQTEKDKMDTQLEAKGLEQKTQDAAAKAAQSKAATDLKERKDQIDAALKSKDQATREQADRDKLEFQKQAEANKVAIALAGHDATREQAQITSDTTLQAAERQLDGTLETAHAQNETTLEVTDRNNSTALEIADVKAEADKAKAKAMANRPKPKAS